MADHGEPNGWYQNGSFKLTPQGQDAKTFVVTNRSGDQWVVLAKEAYRIAKIPFPESSASKQEK